MVQVPFQDDSLTGSTNISQEKVIHTICISKWKMGITFTRALNWIKAEMLKVEQRHLKTYLCSKTISEFYCTLWIKPFFSVWKTIVTLRKEHTYVHYRKSSKTNKEKRGIAFCRPGRLERKRSWGNQHYVSWLSVHLVFTHSRQVCEPQTGFYNNPSPAAIMAEVVWGREWASKTYTVSCWLFMVTMWVMLQIYSKISVDLTLLSLYVNLNLWPRLQFWIFHKLKTKIIKLYQCILTGEAEILLCFPCSEPFVLHANKKASYWTYETPPLRGLHISWMGAGN